MPPPAEPPAHDPLDLQELRKPFLHRAGALGARILSMQPKNPAVAKALQIGIPVVVVGSLVFAIATQAHKLPHSHLRFVPGWFVLAIVALLPIQAVHADIWRRLVRALGYEIEARRAWQIWLVSLLGRYVPTSALMAVGRVAMAEREGVPQRVTVASIAYELVLTVGSALVVGAYFVVTLPELRDQPERWIVVALPVAGLIALHPRIFQRVADFAFHRLGAEPLPTSLGLGRLLGYGLWFLATFICGGLSVYCLAQALHGLSASHLPTAVGSYSVGFAVSVIGFFSPAGLGAREAGVVSSLSGVLSFAVALTLAVVLRLIQIALDVLYAAGATLVVRRFAARASRPAP